MPSVGHASIPNRTEKPGQRFDPWRRAAGTIYRFHRKWRHDLRRLYLQIPRTRGNTLDSFEFLIFLYLFLMNVLRKIALN